MPKNIYIFEIKAFIITWCAIWIPHHWQLPESEYPCLSIHALPLMNLLQDSTVRGRHPLKNAVFWKSCHVCAVLLKICQAVQHLGGRHFILQLLLSSVILLHSFSIAGHPAPSQKGWVDGALSVTGIRVTKDPPNSFPPQGNSLNIDT